MKLHPRTFQILWDAHAWAGVVASLLLYVMFFMGAFALFYPEVNVWAEPMPAEAPHVERPPLGPLLEQLDRERHVLGAERVAFMPERTGMRAYVSRKEGFVDLRYEPATGRLEPARSDLGSFLYSMHYLGPIPYGIWVAGFASMALFLAIISGLFIHLKDLVRQWFQFRPERVARTWSSDMHKVLGVFGLPYQVLYAWTGCVLCLGYLVVEPVFKAVVFGGQDAAMAIARGESAERESVPTGKLSATLPDLDAMVAVAEARLPGMQPNWIGIEHVGDEASTVSMYGDVKGAAFGSVEVVMRARDGEVLSAIGPTQATSYQRFSAWFYGLHYARFGGYAIKLLYAILALTTCAVIVTGNLIWLERRDKRRSHVGNRILERLTVGFCAGVVVATALAFLGNRLLPAAMPERAAAEQWVFWLGWAPAALLPLFWHDARRVSGFELGLAGALFAATVVLDVVTRSSTLSSPVHGAVLAGLTALAATSALIGISLWRPKGPPRSREAQAPAPDADNDLSEADTPHHEAG